MRQTEEFRIARLKAAVPFGNVVVICLTAIFITIWVV